MNDQPIYETSYMGSKIKVFRKRVTFSLGSGERSIMVSQIASIQLGMMGYMQITIETTGGQRYKIPCTKKKEVRDAIYQAQEQL